MNRRDFLRTASGLLIAAGGMSLRPASVLAAPGSAMPRTLVHVMLEGGCDFRYVFAPHPSSDPVYVDAFWNNREMLYKGSFSSYADMFAAEYTEVSLPGNTAQFGVHNTCGWLLEQFNAGNVAIVSNVYASLNRKHDHSMLIVHAGDVTTGQVDVNRDGWGGRLVEAISPQTRVAALSRSVSMFCNGTNPTDRLANVYHGINLRNAALPSMEPASAVDTKRNILIRALDSYYRTRGDEIEIGRPASWPYRRQFAHHKILREFGSAIDERLQGVAMPASLADLDLDDSAFELQCRNLYDSYFVNDLLDSRVVSMNYKNWDQHVFLQNYIEPNLADVFGSSGGLATVQSQLEVDYPDAVDNTVYAFSSDFGRQLAANGSRGTDHGRGSYTVLVGKPLQGGVYGDMFPIREAMPDPEDSQGRTPYEIPGTDINGLTAYERVMGAVSEWVEPGAGAVVFPGGDTSDLEAGVSLDLFA